MMTRGGGHAESDIPAAIDRARDRHPGEKFVYAWPFRASEVAVFLASHLDNFADSRGRAVRA